MAAGMSTKQINSRIRYRLQKFAYELEQAGVKTVYRKFQVCPDMTDDSRDIAFNISYNTYRASNGEAGGFAHITVILSDGTREVYGHMQANGNFDAGMKRIVELFAPEKIARTHNERKADALYSLNNLKALVSILGQDYPTLPSVSLCETIEHIIEEVKSL